MIPGPQNQDGISNKKQKPMTFKQIQAEELQKAKELLRWNAEVCNSKNMVQSFYKQGLLSAINNKIFRAQDFIDSEFSSPFTQGISTLMLLARCAAKGRPEALIFVLKKHLNGFTIADFTKIAPSRKLTEKYNGRSTLSFLAQAAAEGHPEAVLLVLKQFQGMFKDEDFILVQSGTTVKLELEKAQNRDDFITFLEQTPSNFADVFSQYADIFNNPRLQEISKAIATEPAPLIVHTPTESELSHNKKIDAEPDTLSALTSTECVISDSNEIDWIAPEIIGGISNKYLIPVNRTNLKLPMPDLVFTKTKETQNQGNFLKTISLNAFFAQQKENTASPHKKLIIEIANSQLSFYSQDHDVKPEIPCVFVMAGRKINAHFFVPTENVRTILVISQDNFNEIKDFIPASLDYLVIDKLHSPTHGEFKDDELGLITPRRISAFLFTHFYKIERCLVCDDNIDKISLAKEPALKGVCNIYQSMLDHLQDSLSVSVQTISFKKVKEQSGKSRLGSKMFAYNMLKLREQLPKPEQLFYLFPPASCVNWWGEDYFSQIMLLEIAKALKTNGFKTLSLEEFGGLHRLSQHKNSCKNVIKTAEEYIENSDVFIKGIDFTEVEYPFSQQIVKSLTALREIVKDRVESAARVNNRISQLELERMHASANRIEFIQNPSRPIVNYTAKEVFSTSQGELVKLSNILYKHQFNALKSLLESKEPIGHMAMCTGSGKTRDQIAFAHLCATKMPHPIFIIAPTQELVKQIYNEFMATHEVFSDRLESALLKQEIIKVSSSKSDIEQGLLKLEHQHNKNVFIFCEDSFKLFMESERYFKPSALLFDEYHDTRRETINMAIDKLPSNDFVPVIGLSATPVSENHPLSNRLFAYSREEALQDGRVTPIIMDVFKSSYSEVSYRKMLSDMPLILKSTFHPNGQLLSKKKGIIFVNSIEDANKLKKSIERNANIPTFAIHSKVNNQVINEFKKSPIAVAIAVRKLRVGFDDPAVSYVIDLQNTLNTDIFCQIAGRVMRITSSDPNKIGYVISFNNPNIRKFNEITDAVALEKASDVFKLKQSAIYTLRAFSKTLSNLVSGFLTIETQKESKEILKADEFNDALDKIDSQCASYYIGYKKHLKGIFCKDEYKQFKHTDNLSISLKEIDQALSNNQKLYDDQDGDKENKPFLITFKKSIENIQTKVKSLYQNEIISPNKTMCR